MLFTAQEIAKYFRESVLFDFEKESIVSYAQIQREADNFYSLIERDAFEALLNDGIGKDNQLVDIFLDLHSAGLGIQKFSERSARNAPRSIISHFLRLPKYSYHQTDTAKVYLAINTWLVFFGCGEISPQWTKCPFCGADVRDNRCVNAKCRKTSTDALQAMEELIFIYNEVKSGNEAPLPSWWDDIVPDSEFFSEYKRPIEDLKGEKERAENAEFERKKRIAIAAANNIYNSFMARLEVEAAKDSPDFDSLLEEFLSASEIQQAIQYNDKTFAKKVSALKAEITKKKTAHAAKQIEKSQIEQFKLAISKFLTIVSTLRSQLQGVIGAVSDLKILVQEADEEYSKIKAGQDIGLEVESEEICAILNEWNNDLRPSISAYILEAEHREALLSQQNELIALANALLMEIDSASVKDNRAAYLAEKFKKEIETGDRFKEFRIERRAQYSEIVMPITQRISTLLQRENELKLNSFLSEILELLEDIRKAQPRDQKSKIYREHYEKIKSQYGSIKDNVEYKTKCNQVNEKLQLLEKSESEYQVRITELERRKRKKRRILRKLFLSLSIVFVCLAAGLFVCELSGILPTTIVLPVVLREIKGEETGDYIEVIGATGNYKNIDIPEKARLKWHINEKTITGLAADCFASNEEIETITLPATIETIGQEAFAHCDNLKYVVLKSSKPPILGENAFVETNTTIYVPQENYLAYISDATWEQYKENIFPDFGNDIEHGCIIFNVIEENQTHIVESHPLNTLLTPIDCPVRKGYQFTGWYYYENGLKQPFDFNTSLLTHSLKLYASWDFADYQVTLDYNGGVGDLDSLYVTYGDTIGELPKPNRAGYSFAGWYYGDRSIDESTAVDFTSDIVIKAAWNPNVYEVTFDYQEGITGFTKKDVTFDDVYGELPITSRLGYLFQGWYYNNKLITENSVVMVSSDHRLIAKWKPITYTIFLETDGGEISDGEINCLYDESYVLGTSSKKGYTFLYWESETGTHYQAEEEISNLISIEGGEITLRAIYEKDIYTISYDMDGGLNNPLNPNNYSVDSDDIIFASPTKAGYTFVAWYSNAEKTSIIESILSGSTGDTSVYAKWNPNKNILHFNANGGTGDMPDAVIATDATYYLPSNKFVKRGYTFIGWKTSPDEDLGASYSDEAKYVMGVDSEYTLYAVWEKRVYEISYQTNGGVNDMTNPSSYTIDSPTIELKNANRDGYTFIAWCKDSSLTESVTTIDNGSTGNITLYAKWSANENTLHFDPNGGEGSMTDQKIKTGETAQLQQNLFSKSGSKFAGWGYAPGGSSVYGERAAYTMGPQSNYTLYAIWTQTAYTIQYNLNGGTNSTANPNGYNSEGGTIVLAAPSKTGNTFDGWYKDSSFASNSRVTQINNGDRGDLILYAKWIKNRYQVTFDYNGGSGSPTSKEVTYSEAYGSLPDASRTGYTFNGWYYNNNRIYDNTEVIVDSAHKLVAEWSINSYIIYINENHVDIKVVRNDTGAEVQTGASIPYNTSLTISFTTNSGYHDGWCDYSGQTINMPADNLTINSGATQDSNCVAKGTLVKTADFRDVPIEKLNVGDLILSWDYRTKSWTATPITLLVYHGDSLTDIITLEFSNGRKIKVVDSHEFYDVSKRAYVTIGLYNFSEYLGDMFVCYNDGDGIDAVQLVNAYKSQEYTGSYTIVSSHFYNCITNDIVSATPNIPGIYELISSYLDADLNFDSQLLQEDIDKYGIYEYDLFAECLSYEQYSGLCAAYFKIAAGKGYTTFEEIYYLMMMFSYVYL